ncbi:hypothetical protein BP6252_00397 [Coleophoma cylindrospora]|uniref:N-acetyltransferase domain-containing protein n=1 Tax=Coleophoma cylindrospora TaxID=1849047 RepID=A0A3D8SPX6_9HELO|nr:hypothetical protein BP6252_00397 [Coleophoma cylindrospora]
MTTKPTPPAYSLRRSTSADIAAIAQLLQAVYETDAWTAVASGAGHNTAEQLASLAGSVERDLGAKGKRVVQCVEEGTGEVVGVGIWGEGNVDAGHEGEGEEDGAGWPPGTNIAFCTDAYVVADAIMEEACRGQPFLKLWEIAIHPRYQNQGLGTSLMKEFIGEVEEKKVQAVLGASKEGLGLYEKFGFERIREMEFDLEKYTGGEVKGTEKHVVMWRPRTTTSEGCAVQVEGHS